VIVAAYLAMAGEPPTAAILDELSAAGHRVLLPVLRRDLDLDWALHRTDSGTSPLRPGRFGLQEPSGPAEGVAAIRGAQLVIVPALAVDRDGRRLGRGGGSYDRALARVRPGVPVVALLHDGELVDQVPAAAHDRRVTHVALPSGLVSCLTDEQS
jgi:5-formyltetrahydrofolate cyclo-ligase